LVIGLALSRKIDLTAAYNGWYCYAAIYPSAALPYNVLWSYLIGLIEEHRLKVIQSCDCKSIASSIQSISSLYAITTNWLNLEYPVTVRSFKISKLKIIGLRSLLFSCRPTSHERNLTFTKIDTRSPFNTSFNLHGSLSPQP
jgi:hypothetical protein